MCGCLCAFVCSGPGISVWTESDYRLVSSALCVLSELPSICSPEGELMLTLAYYQWQILVLKLMFSWMSVLLQEVCPFFPPSFICSWESWESWSTGPHILVTQKLTNILNWKAYRHYNGAIRFFCATPKKHILIHTHGHSEVKKKKEYH